MEVLLPLVGGAGFSRLSSHTVSPEARLKPAKLKPGRMKM
jgi:hypothetical protein